MEFRSQEEEALRVLQDMGLLKHKVAYIVLGAAVLDEQRLRCPGT